LGAILLLVYTSIFTVPFLLNLGWFFLVFGSFRFFRIAYEYSVLGEDMSLYACIIIFLVFAVKLPVYGLHVWLPVAHVEAPTFGSMLLAGVLLKLGGAGLVRCYFFFREIVKLLILRYRLVFITFVTYLCRFQSDFKRIVAYSSVSHMMAIPILLVSYSFLRQKALLLILIFHGFSSCLLFSLVGDIYFMVRTRQFIIIRGLFLVSPLIGIVLLLVFLFTLGVPPFFSFVGEVFFFLCLVIHFELV